MPTPLCSQLPWLHQPRCIQVCIFTVIPRRKRVWEGQGRPPLFSRWLRLSSNVLGLSFPPQQTPCPFLPPRPMPSLRCIPEYYRRHDGRVSRQSRGTLQGCLNVTRRCWGLEQTILLQARVTVQAPQGVASRHLSQAVCLTCSMPQTPGPAPDW